ncbi:MAG TPA: cyanophycinase [Deinococcales bacterium]|nr:cyanophycinase [Deinococcales bacterium]
MARKVRRALVVIGGHEDRTGSKRVLDEVARRAGKGPLVVTTVASREPDGLFEIYEKAFHDLGVKDVRCLRLGDRAEALDEKNSRILEEATGLFFTGGDQLRITSQIGDTPVYQRAHALYDRGAVLAGTSAGASVMSAVMMVSGTGEASHVLGDSLRLAPGFGIVDGMIFDQHFAERRRISRLLTAVAQNPRELGIGIDEGTGVVIEDERDLSVVGDGAVYILDGAGITSSNIAEGHQGQTVAVFDLRVHVLCPGDRFDLRARLPSAGESHLPDVPEVAAAADR